jgi:formate hydrogenlyase subunit 3/multisubunit Na+/H+ antiporter MnhD subunit
MFSLAGIPPAAGFLGKLMLFSAAIQAHLYGLAALGLLASVVGVFYYLMIVVRMFMSPAEREIGPLAKAPLANFAVVVCALVTMLLFFFAEPVIREFKEGYISSAPSNMVGIHHLVILGGGNGYISSAPSNMVGTVGSQVGLAIAKSAPPTP